MIYFKRIWQIIMFGIWLITTITVIIPIVYYVITGKDLVEKFANYIRTYIYL